MPAEASSFGAKGLLVPFLAVLQSPEPITLPHETLFGGITHFLSTLTGQELEDLVSALISSPSTSSDRSLQAGLRNAARLAVHAKVTDIDRQLNRVYFSSSRRASRAKSWLNDLGGLIVSQKRSNGRDQLLTGVVQGLSECPEITWSKTQATLQEQLVLAAAEDTPNTTELVSLALTCVDEHKLRALDLEGVLPRLQNVLLQSVRDNNDTEKCGEHARALARAFIVMDHGGPSTRRQSWDGIRQFCFLTRDNIPAMRMRSQSTNNIVIISKDNDWDHQKMAFFAFLLPATSIVEILLSSQPPTTTSPRISTLPPSAELSIEILITLGSFTELIDHSQGSLEGYRRVLFGALDVLAANGGLEGVRILLRNLVHSNSSPAHAAFILLAGEQLINEVDGSSLREILLPLCQQYVLDPVHKSSFEAAHAMLLAIIEAATRTLELTIEQDDFLNELIPFYARVLLKQVRDDEISPDQFRLAYPLIVESASRGRLACIDSCNAYLNEASFQTNTEETLIPTLRLTRISIAPFISRPNLPQYLDDLASIILDTAPRSSRRSELAEAAFKMVIEELPDESKTTGLEWWMKWKDEILGKEQMSERAKL